MFANTQNGAMNLAFPDVCKTVTPAGPVPVPFPNMAVSTAATPNVFNIFIGGGLAHNLMTTVSVSSGDEGGVAMGVVSNMIVGTSQNLLGSFKVFHSVAPATRLTSPTLQNTCNAVGATLTPSQVSVLLLS